MQRLVKSKTHAFVIALVLFLTYSVGLVLTTIRVGFQAYRVQPVWGELVLSWVVITAAVGAGSLLVGLMLLEVVRGE